MTFKTKKSFLEFNKPVFRRLENGGEMTPEERGLLLAGFRTYHPNIQGVEVADVGFTRNAVTGNGVFFAIRPGGRRISMNRACRRTTDRARCMKALRGSVDDQIREWSRAGHEVDHCGAGFKALAERWISEQGLTVATLAPHCVKVDVLDNPTNSRVYDYIAGELGDDWQAFHKEHAQLQSIPIAFHRQLTKARRVVAR